MATKHFVRAFLFVLVGLGLSSAQALTPQQVGDILVLVRTEVSGTDNIYHYELVNRGTVKMMGFSIGVEPVGEGPPEAIDDSYGTLTRLPTGTMWGPAPVLSLEFPGMPNTRADWDIPIPGQGSITSPPGWRAEISGIRVPGVALDAEDLAEERYSVRWFAPKPVYGGPVNVTGADAGQRLAGFSVRVPRDSTTGPGAVGSASNYTQGQFQANVWSGSAWLNKAEQKRRGPIIVTPTTLVSFSSDIPMTGSDGAYQIITTASNPVATITANLLPLDFFVYPTIKLESITCYGECTSPTVGISGAAFGTDDRTFQLYAVPSKDSLTHSRYFMVEYSATTFLWSNRIYTGILYSVTGPSIPGALRSIYVPNTGPRASSYIVVWSEGSGVTYYELQERTKTDQKGAVFGAWSTIYTGKNLNVTVPGRGILAYYNYRVRACNTSGCSDYITSSDYLAN